MNNAGNVGPITQKTPPAAAPAEGGIKKSAPTKSGHEKLPPNRVLQQPQPSSDMKRTEIPRPIHDASFCGSVLYHCSILAKPSSKLWRGAYPNILSALAW